MALDRATVKQMKDRAARARDPKYKHYVKSGFAPAKAEIAAWVEALAEDWLRQQEALVAADITLGHCYADENHKDELLAVRAKVSAALAPQAEEKP